VIAERIGWPTPNSGIDLPTLGATLDVRVIGGNHIRLRAASDPSGGVARFRAPEADRSSVVDAWSVNPRHAVVRDNPRSPNMASSEALQGLGLGG